MTLCPTFFTLFFFFLNLQTRVVTAAHVLVCLHSPSALSQGTSTKDSGSLQSFYHQCRNKAIYFGKKKVISAIHLKTEELNQSIYT